MSLIPAQRSNYPSCRRNRRCLSRWSAPLLTPLGSRALSAAFVGLSACLLVSLPLATIEAAPAIGRLSINGLQSGGKTIVAVEGSELSADTQLVVAAPGVTHAVRPGATAQRVEYEVTVAADVPAPIKKAGDTQVVH